MPLPSDWPQLSAAVYYDEPARAIDWLCAAFGFAVKMKIEGENGEIHHSELTYGAALIMVSGTARPDLCGVSPRALDGRNTQGLMMYVEDVDAHCATARAGGAQITKEPTDTDYGEGYWADRGYEAIDCEGHRWWFAQRIRG